MGALVPRAAEPVDKAGCPGGWYQIKPRGFVCAGEDATTDLSSPILKAAVRRPNLRAALPYRYAFVRAVLPMYLRVPTSEEQLKSEFKLQEHLDWYKQNEADVSKVLLGANDVAIDAHGVPVPEKKLGEVGLGKSSQEMGIGVLLGGDSENDEIPGWLAGGRRSIPNISDFKTKGFEVFADRARRHTGLALVGSFPTGPSPSTDGLPSRRICGWCRRARSSQTPAHRGTASASTSRSRFPWPSSALRAPIRSRSRTARPSLRKASSTAVSTASPAR